MKKSVFVLMLFLMQNYLVTNGTFFFDKLLVPFLILTVSAAIAVWYFKATLSAEQQDAVTQSPASPKNRVFGFIAGALSIVVLWKPFKNMFVKFPDPASGSDIIPQLATLYSRFCKGIQPYYPLEQFHWHPFPVYMPLHWLPLGLGYLFNIDIRWAGFIFMSVASGIFGYHLWSSGDILKKIVSISLQAVVLCFFIHWGKTDLAVSFELVIAAYYLLLCVGLVTGDLVLITLAIIACLMSRYTVIFWLPLFFILLSSNVSKKKNLLVWSSIILACVLLYFVPFYLRDPSILRKGLQYHNMCYVDAWNGLGNPDQATAFDKGLNFSWFICHGLSGDMYHRVLIARIIQAFFMIAMLVTGIILYKKWKHKISYNHFGLGMLYCVMIVFFMFNPVNYQYYYITVLCVSAVLCGRIILVK